VRLCGVGSALHYGQTLKYSKRRMKTDKKRSIIAKILSQPKRKTYPSNEKMYYLLPYRWEMLDYIQVKVEWLNHVWALTVGHHTSCCDVGRTSERANLASE
jgi:hypothetical protein